MVPFMGNFQRGDGWVLYWLCYWYWAAVAAVLSDTFRQFLKPYIIIVEATPRIALGPIFVTWFGFGMSSKVALAALVCFCAFC